MRILLTFFVVLFFWNFEEVYCNGDSSFITIWAPKFAQERSPYTVMFLPQNINDDIKAVFQFRDEKTNVTLENGKLAKIEFSNENSFDLNKSSFGVTFYRTSDGQNLCSTSNRNVKEISKNFNIFIQTDKPFYKPGDSVKFRVLVVDKNLKPWHMTSIDVSILDPLGRNIRLYSENDTIGVFEGSFNIMTTTILGNWTIQAVVDKNQQLSISKQFSVQKYVLPLFNVDITTIEKQFLRKSDIKISFHAIYSFGEFVKGNAELVIKNLKTDQKYLTKIFKNVEEVETVTYNIIHDLKVEDAEILNLEAKVNFTEPESGLSFDKSTTFVVYNKTVNRIVAIHPEKFTPGSEFTTQISIVNWKNEKVKTQQKIELTFGYVFLNGSEKSVEKLLKLSDGTASYKAVLPDDLQEIDMQIEFSGCEVYKKKIEMGKSAASLDGLEVNYSPQNPSVNSEMKINIKGPTNLNTVYMMIMTKLGAVKAETLECGKKPVCYYKLQITEDMIPYSTVTVFQVQDQQHIYRGSTRIVTEQLGINHLEVSLSTNKARTNEKIYMNFVAPKQSKVYLLAFDKRLKQLGDGNDMKKDDVVGKVDGYDENYEIIIDDMLNFEACKDSDYERIPLTKPETPQGDFMMKFGDDEQEQDEGEENVILRENFPETWIFESIDIGESGMETKEFSTPDSITTWEISAFSVNEEFGLSIAPTEELTVMNEFFMKINLPYSIRYQEILRVDVLVYNYVETLEPLNVTVDLQNMNYGTEFQFAVYDQRYGSCSVSFNNDTNLVKSVKVPPLSVKKVSFYIRSNPQNQNIRKYVKLQVEATANDDYGDIYHDFVLKELLVEPVGVRVHKVDTKSFILNGTTSEAYTATMDTDYILESVNVLVNGLDYLGFSTNFSSNFEIYPNYCLEQKTSLLKGNVEYFRYLKSKEQDPPTEYFSDHYQQILRERIGSWYYGHSLGYRAYFIEAIASAMEVGALPIDKEVVKSELNFIKNNQKKNGDFDNFGNFITIHRTSCPVTVKYFETAYVLIPFLKFTKLVDENYDDVISKGLNFLNEFREYLTETNEVLSIAAYAYALNNDAFNANNLLDEIEKSFLVYGENKKCFKSFKYDTYCDLRHTAYTALTYVTLNDVSKAKPLVNWLLEKYNYDYYFSNTLDVAIGIEPIAKLLKYLKDETTNLSITLKNERNYQEFLTITNDNSDELQNVELPQNSYSVSAIVEGYGYCSVTTIFETLVRTTQLSTNFSVKAEVISYYYKGNEKNVNICASYNPHHYISLMSVIYEVEIPSGYVFSGIESFDKKYGMNIKLIEERREGTLIYLYYDYFESNINYCVNVFLTKKFEVNGIKQGSVKIYDYYNKENAAILFYQIPSEECNETSNT